jgi:lipoprotein-anchoring transpeptidase ErfK/SrfK
MATHRASRREVRRRGRVGALVLALAVTVVAGGAAVGGVPGGGESSAADAEQAAPAAMQSVRLPQVSAPKKPVAVTPAPVTEKKKKAPALPDGSGSGTRIVFDESDQRVWLVDDDEVVRTYPVSGSRFDNLDPGAYAVQSKTRHATAFDASGTMEYFVRFATGFSEPIGFHSVPRDNEGKLEQTKDQLGTPLSAGCVRQWEPDAIALWEFADIGTKVVVTA